jgi:hypothetical protein
MESFEMTPAQEKRYDEIIAHHAVLDTECLVSVCLACGTITEAADYADAVRFARAYDTTCHIGVTVFPNL